MIQTRKIRIYPNKTQMQLISETLGACRWVYNKYIEFNQRVYTDKKIFLSGYDFDKRLTSLKKDKPEFEWLNKYSSKALKDSIMRAEKSYKAFFKKKSARPPKFKGRRDAFQSYFFIKDGIKFKDNKVKIPILKWIKYRESGYELDINKISGGRIILENGMYFVSFTYNEENIDHDSKDKYTSGIGIDVGVKTYATISNKDNILYIRNINRSRRVIELEERIRTLQRIISNKVEINKNMKKGKESYGTSQIKKLRYKIRKSQVKLNNIRKDFIDKLCYSLVIAKPKFITIEDLSISNMLQVSDSTLSDSLSKCKLYYFRTKLIHKSHQYNIELRLANRFFASSKTCSCCGHKKNTLSLSDRIYKCDECGYVIDRDVNAAINLRKLKKYTIL